MTRPTDPMEAIIYDALKKGDIVFSMGPKTPAGLDFHLSAYDLHIEVKRMHSPRIAEQMSRADNVIAVQGEVAVRWLAKTIVLAAEVARLRKESELIAQECYQAVACIAPYDADLAVQKQRAMRRTEAFLETIRK